MDNKEMDSTEKNLDTNVTDSGVDKNEIDEMEVERTDEDKKNIVEQDTDIKVSSDISALTDIIFQNHEEAEIAKRKKKGDAPTGLKVVGVISLLMAVLGAGVMVVCFYFMMIAPSYDKTDADYDPLEQGIYTELSWISSVEPAAPLATLTDAEETVASTTDAE